MAARKGLFNLIEHTTLSAPRRRGVYLIPNLITAGALFAGFYAIVAAMHGNFAAAGIAIFIAMVLDVLDGRVARMMRSESEFGAQFDSLSDMVAFGVAPALVVFEWGLTTLAQIGWVVTFVYMACAALRLARFNTSGQVAAFTGLPSPMAAGFVASAVWLWTNYFAADPSAMSAVPMALLVLLAGLLMVSNVEYYSPKLFRVRGRVPFVTMIICVVAFSVIIADPPLVLFVATVCYAISGPVRFVVARWSVVTASGEDEDTDPIDEEGTENDDVDKNETRDS